MSHAGLRYCSRRDRFVVFVACPTARTHEWGIYADARAAEVYMRILNAQFAESEGV